MSAALVLPLTEVKENGRISVDVSVSPSDFPDILDSGQLIAPVAVKGNICRKDDEAVFEGAASGRWRLECTRCLAPVETSYAAPVEHRAPIDGGPMDLSDEVRQSIILAQPMKIHCRPDCKGLCPLCRRNRNLEDCGHAVAESSSRPRLTVRPDKG